MFRLSKLIGETSNAEVGGFTNRSPITARTYINSRFPGKNLKNVAHRYLAKSIDKKEWIRDAEDTSEPLKD